MIGHAVSHYRVLEKLGEGGMGVVYKAHDVRLDREVALKFLPQEFTGDKVARERFIREAQTASSLDHRNICTIYDIDTDPQGRMFIVMPLYSGETLRQRIERHPLAPEEAGAVVSQIAEGLAKAHEKGIVHCDVKPANIFLTSEGEVKILDFGVSRLKSDLPATRDSSLGTLPYMSPEQIAGGPVDARSDIWSLGVLLYESLSGRIPFAGRYPSALMYSIVNETPPPLASLRPDTPSGLVSLVDQCLEKEPERRPESMHTVIRILRPDQDRPAGLRPKRRTRRWILACAIGGMLLIAAWSAWRHLASPAALARTAQVGILPFRNMTRDPRATEWPNLIQALMYNYLIGLREIRPAEPNTMNAFMTGAPPSGETVLTAGQYAAIREAGISYLIRGTISRPDSLFILRASLTDLATQDIMHTSAIALRDEEELTAKIQLLLNELTGFFQMKSVLTGHDKDLSPWFAHRSIHLGAMKEFLRASHYIFNGMPGSIAPLRRAVELDSNFISARVWLISGLVQQNNRAEAEQHLRSLQRMYAAANPFEQAMIDWARTFIAGDKYGQVRALEMALSYSPKNNIILQNLSSVRFELGDYEGALESILSALEMRWEFPPAYQHLAMCYFQLNRHAEAQDVLNHILKMKSIYWDSYGLLAVYARHRRDTTAAGEWEDKYIRRIEEFGIEQGMAEFELGKFYSDCRLPDAALPRLRRAVSMEPSNVEYLSALGETLRDLYRPTEAMEAFLAALRIDSTLTGVRFQLGKLYEQQGDRANAHAQYRLLLRTDSVSSQAVEARKRLQRSSS